jgi:hypothetical protein
LKAGADVEAVEALVLVFVVCPKPKTGVWACDVDATGAKPLKVFWD